MFRATLCCAALATGLAHRSERQPPPAACEGDGCSSKPLNIMQFMREQAASTRVGQGRRHAAMPQPATAKAPRAPHRAIAARQKPVRMPVEAATSVRVAAGAGHASCPAIGQRRIQSLSTAPPMRLRPKRRARPSQAVPNVQLVDAEDINDIDRKADSSPRPVEPIRRRSTVARRTASKPTFPGCGGSGLRSEAPSRRWQRRCTNSSAV